MPTPEELRARGALAGYRVLEVGSTVAGPFCARLFADFGADVIKVEDVKGDPVRGLGEQHGGKSLYAASIFRNKSMIAADLRTEDGREIVRRLAQQSDVLVENFKPGTLESWGLGYDALSAGNPGLVMVRISGFGQSGPYSERPGYGIIGEAISGLRHLVGDPDRPPARVAIPLTDYITGLYAAFGAMMALRARDITGRGQVVDTALYECAFSFTEPTIPGYEKTGAVAMRQGPRMPGSVPNSLYPTRDNAWLQIAAVSDGVFRKLAQAIGRADLTTHPDFATAMARRTRPDEVDAIVSAWTRTMDARPAQEHLLACGVPTAQVNTIADIFSDPHFAARGMLAAVPDDDLGTVTVSAPVPRLSDTPGALRKTGGQPGRDTARVLRDTLGMADAEIERLARAGAVKLGR